MLYYHGTTKEFKKFSLNEAKDYKDFGKGIYLSFEKWHAEAIANKSPNSTNKYVIICDFDIGELRKLFKTKEFKKASEEWVKYVLEKRNRVTQSEYDIIIGDTSDASAQDLLNRFWNIHYDRRKKVINASRKDYKDLITQLNTYKYPRQICFSSPQAVKYLNGKIKERNSL